MSLNKKSVFLSLLFAFPVLAFAQVSPETTTDKNKLNLLKEYNDQATSLYNSFKNGPAFEYLIKYGELKESIFKEQAEREINKKQADFKNEITAQQKKLSETNQFILTLQGEQGSLVSEKNKLLRNTILYFLLMIGLAVFVMISKSQSATRELMMEKISTMQLNQVRKMSDVADGVTLSLKDLLFSFQSVQDLSQKSLTGLSKLKSMAITLNKEVTGIRKVEESLSKISSLSTEAKLFSDHLDSLMNAEKGEKEVTNLNKILEESLHLSYHWIKSRNENFECTIVRDLEKILPDFSIIPGAIGEAMFHFFNNAFQSVLEKKLVSGKSYQPKVSVSSRKLPQFIQVRIKDNGNGMDEKTRQKVFEPFFTTRSPEWSTGLGLTTGMHIIKTKHKGELIFESEPGNGTDLVIRFPLNVQM